MRTQPRFDPVVLACATLALLLPPQSASAQSSASFPLPEPEPRPPVVAPPAPAVPPPGVPARPVAPAAYPPRVAGAPAPAVPTPGLVPAPSPPPSCAAPPYAQVPYAQPVAAAPFYPTVLPYRDGDPVPDGYVLERRANTGLMVGGGLVFGLGYVTAFGIAASNSFDRPSGMLAVPVVGPWIALRRRESPCNIDDVEVRGDAESCVDSALDEAAMIAVIAIDGLVQGVGAGLFLGGALSRTSLLIREESPPPGTARIVLSPRRFGRSGYGLGLAGSF